jgi:hypothetical protein
MKSQTEMIRWMIDFHLWLIVEQGIYMEIQNILGLGCRGFYNMNKTEVRREYSKLRKEAKYYGYKE